MDGLPEDAELRIVEFSRRADAWLNDGKSSSDDSLIIIASLRFIEQYLLKFDIAIPSRDDDEVLDGVAKLQDYVSRILKFGETVSFRHVENEVDAMVDALEAEVFGETFGIAKLNKEEKSAVHKSIDIIRSIVEDSQLSEKKKNALFDRLNDLAREVDSIGTRTDRFFAAASEFAFALGDFAKKSKPLTDEIKDMIKIVSRARGRQEGVSLPPGDEPMALLPPPELHQ